MADQGNREPGTLSQLFARHRERFVRFARQLVGRKDSADAEDCVQDATAEFVKQPRDYNSESHFVRLFRRFMVFSSRGHRRNERAEKRGGEHDVVPLPTGTGMDPGGDQTGPRTAAARQDLHAALLAHIDRLKPEYQQVLELRLIRDQTWRDIADELGLSSADAARKKYDYAIKQLRERTRHLDSRADGAGGALGKSEVEHDG